MKKRKISRKRNIALSIVIILAVSLAFSGGFCIMCGLNQEWVEFSVCLVIAIITIFIIIPLNYVGAIYVCPKCGNKFKVNPYKVFFTHGIFYFGVYSPKQTKLKCPNCKIKDWCKNEYE